LTCAAVASAYAEYPMINVGALTRRRVAGGARTGRETGSWSGRSGSRGEAAVNGGGRRQFAPKAAQGLEASPRSIMRQAGSRFAPKALPPGVSRGRSPRGQLGNSRRPVLRRRRALDPGFGLESRSGRGPAPRRHDLAELDSSSPRAGRRPSGSYPPQGAPGCQLRRPSARRNVTARASSAVSPSPEIWIRLPTGGRRGARCRAAARREPSRRAASQSMPRDPRGTRSWAAPRPGPTSGSRPRARGHA
jgi:hypothetical protein